jgi:hypothetical protein
VQTGEHLWREHPGYGTPLFRKSNIPVLLEPSVEILFHGPIQVAIKVESNQLLNIEIWLLLERQLFGVNAKIPKMTGFKA